GADFCCGTRQFRADGKVALRTTNGHTLAPHSGEIRSQQEMDFVAGAAKLGAVETADRATTNDGDFHGQSHSASTHYALRNTHYAPRIPYSVLRSAYLEFLYVKKHPGSDQGACRKGT